MLWLVFGRAKGLIVRPVGVEPQLEIAAVQRVRRACGSCDRVSKITLNGLYFSGVRDQEVQQETLPTPGRAEHERTPDIVDVEVESRAPACRDAS